MVLIRTGIAASSIAYSQNTLLYFHCRELLSKSMCVMYMYILSHYSGHVNTKYVNQ